MLALAVTPAVVFSIADGVSRYHGLIEERSGAFLDAAVVDAQATRDVIVGLRAVATTITLDPDVEAFREPECSSILSRVVAANPLFRLAVAVDAGGDVRCAAGPVAEEVNFSSDPAFRAMSVEPAFRLAVRNPGRVTGEEVVIGAAPLMVEGRFAGVVSISVAARSLRFLAQTSGDAAERRPFRAIVGAGGAILLDTEGGDAAGTWLPGGDLAGRLSLESGRFVAPSVDGVERFYAVSPFVSGQAWLIAGSDETALRAAATLRVLPAMVTPLIMLAIAVGVAYFALDRLVLKHIVHLSDLTRAYGRGRLELRPKLAGNTPQEIASLADTLGAMAEALAERQRELQLSAETNRVLLLEVYHRVRNNLQMVASLVNLQMRRAGIEPERLALERIHARIHSLALVHEKLHASDVVDQLDLAQLLGDVVRSIVEPASQGARLRLSLALDARREAAERATPLALFLSEAVVNAVKHAGGAAGAPEVSVTLRAEPDGALTLTVANDVAAEGAPTQKPSLGSRLMEGFARQLRATLTQGRDGARYVVILQAPGDAAAAPTT